MIILLIRKIFFCTLRFVKSFGELAEWLKAHAWKACLVVTLTGVRIPHSPQGFLDKTKSKLTLLISVQFIFKLYFC